MEIQTHHHHSLFEKTLSPSDVGKLYRLVIPKKYAKKYFPLIDQETRLFLRFQDESGKLWFFRYSYWKSNDSYMFTSGWSRYVKEKRLNAWDIVLFERDTFDHERMFVRCRRGPKNMLVEDQIVATTAAQRVRTGGAQQARTGSAQQANYPSYTMAPVLPLPYQLGYLHRGGTNENGDNYRREMTTTRLRLFGVDIECPTTSHSRVSGVTMECRDDSRPSTVDGPSQLRN